MGFSYGFFAVASWKASRLHPTATQESLQAHGGLNGCNRGIRASPTCGIASGRFGPRGVTIGSNELGKLSGFWLGIPGKFRRGAWPYERSGLLWIVGEILCLYGLKFTASRLVNADARNWATVERSLFFKPIDIGWNPRYAQENIQIWYLPEFLNQINCY